MSSPNYIFTVPVTNETAYTLFGQRDTRFSLASLFKSLVSQAGLTPDILIDRITAYGKQEYTHMPAVVARNRTIALICALQDKTLSWETFQIGIAVLGYDTLKMELLHKEQ